MIVPVELKRKYLTRRIQDLAKIRDALINNDFAPALKLGHQVKGNAHTFEFPQMTVLGVELEDAAKRGDKESLLAIANQMELMITSDQLYPH